MKQLYDIIVPMLYDRRVDLMDFLRVFPYLRNWKLKRREECDYIPTLRYYFSIGYIVVRNSVVWIIFYEQGRRDMEFFEYLQFRKLVDDKYNTALESLILAGT